MRQLRLLIHSFIAFIALVIATTGCSLYKSDGREAIEKNSANIVTGSGVNLHLNVRYQCELMMAIPADWQAARTPLDEFAALEDSKAILLTGAETPVVVVYTWIDRHVEACSLAILDAKLSSHHLREVVGYGESLLVKSTRR